MKKIVAVMLIILFLTIPVTIYADDYVDDETIIKEIQVEYFLKKMDTQSAQWLQQPK